MMNLAAYLAFAFGYFNFINLNVASLRIRMLQELMESGGTMPAAAFAACYKTEGRDPAASIASSAAAT